MTVHTQPWEHRLQLWAYTAFNSDRLSWTSGLDNNMLALAYRHSADLTRLHSRTFFLASSLLPPDKRRAVRALYAVCRITDNLVDAAHAAHDPAAALQDWRQRVMAPHPPAYDPVCLAWVDTQVRYGIPRGYVEQLIDGVARDLQRTRYATFDELAEYSYGVASTVGLMVMHIVGFAGQQALSYAVKLGVALQLTNILRDVAEDWRAGRLYLPQDELAAFGLREADIARGQVDDRWRAFMRFQIARNRQLYAEARPGIAMLAPDGRFAIAAAADLYQGILDDIEAHDYDVFHRRARLGAVGKLARLPGIWWRSRRQAPGPQDGP